MSKLQAETFHNEDLKLHLLRLEQIENKSFNNGRAGAILPSDLHWCDVSISNHIMFVFFILKPPESEEHNITILAQ